MMFAPRFGMVIVPGCDGIRGSATMVYLALLIGYLRRMGTVRTALLMLAGLATGYLLNLTRLCTLVLYCWVGVHFPHLRGNGELIDYCIGGTLFLLVSVVAGYLLFRPLPRSSLTAAAPRSTRPSRVPWRQTFQTPRWIAATLLLAAAAVTAVPSAWALLFTPDDYIAPAVAEAALPAQAGPWHMGEHWREDYYGQTVWLWTAYHRDDGASIALAVWLSPKRHYAIQSRLMNGSKPLVGNHLNTTAADALPVELSTFTLQDDLVEHSLPIPTYFAETICVRSHCSVQEAGFQQTGWIIALNPVDVRMNRRLPLLFRVQSVPGGQETPEVQADARREIAGFINTLDLKSLTEKLGAH